MSNQYTVNTKFLRKVKVGQMLKDKAGSNYKIIAVYNQGTPAQQVHLEGEHYPHLLTELVKMGYSLRRR